MSPRSTYSPFPLINLALDHVKLLVGVPLASAVIAVLLGVAVGGRYVADSSFKPQSEQADLSRVSGLAAQFGIDVPGGGGGESVDFYARLVQSRALLEEVVRREYPFSDDRGPVTLLELYGGDDGERSAVRQSVDILARNIGVDTDINAGVIAVHTWERDPLLAERINRAILDEINRFNLEQRQSQAAAEREFVENQVDSAQADLAAAEDALSEFMQSNRRYEEWPELRFEAARLQRQVDLQQQVMTTLLQSLEQARLDEVRNTPVVTIINAPEGSAKRERKLAQKAVLGAVLGLTLVLAWLFAREYRDRLKRQYPDEYARMRQRRLWLGALLLITGAGCEGSAVEPVEAPLAMVAVSAGANHTCALTDDGVAYCWGRGLDGELGNGAYASSDVPVPVVTTLRFRAISAGHAHTCALTEEGSPWCWGWNAYFQRGNPMDTATGRPVSVHGEHRFLRIDAGSHHTCALKANGSAWCWGYNRYGQVGDGTTATQAVPIEVMPGQRFDAVTAGGNHTCALTTTPEGPNGMCWGLNASGQLGAGTDAILRTSPAAVRGDHRFGQISAGYDHTCGLVSSQLYCWGGNAHGQLANGGAVPEGLPGATEPTPSPSPRLYAHVTAGMHTSCAIATNSWAYCWGRNHAGQLGIGTDIDQYHPQPVHLQPGGRFDAELLTFESVSTGAQHTCGVTRENAIYCWGDGRLGQLGVGDAFFATLPRRVGIME